MRTRKTSFKNRVKPGSAQDPSQAVTPRPPPRPSPRPSPRPARRSLEADEREPVLGGKWQSLGERRSLGGKVGKTSDPKIRRRLSLKKTLKMFKLWTDVSDSNSDTYTDVEHAAQSPHDNLDATEDGNSSFSVKHAGSTPNPYIIRKDVKLPEKYCRPRTPASRSRTPLMDKNIFNSEWDTLKPSVKESLGRNKIAAKSAENMISRSTTVKNTGEKVKKSKEVRGIRRLKSKRKLINESENDIENTPSTANKLKRSLSRKLSSLGALTVRRRKSLAQTKTEEECPLRSYKSVGSLEAKATVGSQRYAKHNPANVTLALDSLDNSVLGDATIIMDDTQDSFQKMAMTLRSSRGQSSGFLGGELNSSMKNLTLLSLIDTSHDNMEYETAEDDRRTKRKSINVQFDEKMGVIDPSLKKTWRMTLRNHLKGTDETHNGGFGPGRLMRNGAGNTPIPSRRKRHPSYEERLI